MAFGKAGVVSKHEATPGERDRARAGAASACACYFLWGLVPLFWKQLSMVGAVELIAHRTVWSLAFLGLLLAGMADARAEALRALRSRSALLRMALGAVLLTINWLAYVWGVNHGRIIETSLGYFLVPLCSVLAGRLLLHENLRRVQAIAIGLAVLGVAGMVIQAGGLPWIALALAGSWSLYSVLRKKARVAAVPGLAIETLLMSPLAVAYIAWMQARGVGAMGRLDATGHAFLLSTGVVTAVPLLFFAHAAPRIRLSTLGVLQYIAPSLQLLIGVAVYREPLQTGRLACFALIWAALVLYSADTWFAQRRGAAG
jgi:chloramphenicol-sensitive protein RarD